MGSSFIKPKKSHIRKEWQKNTDEWWQECWKPLWSSRTPSAKPRFMFCLPALFSYIYGIDVRVKCAQSMMFTAVQLCVLCSCSSSGPLSSLWPSPQVGQNGISWDLRRVVQLDGSGSAWLCGSYLRVGGCGDPVHLRAPPAAAVHMAAEGGGLQLTDAGSARMERLCDVTLRRAARACGGCEGWLGGWRRWKLPDKENMLAATSPAWSQLCVSHWILEPRGGITGRIHNSAVKTPRLFLSRLSENQAWAQVALRRFICTPSLANGKWNWETPRNLSFPHQCLFFFGLLDLISGPVRIIILESVFVGASTGTEQIHPVFSCYLFIVEYAEAALLFFWRWLRRCQVSASRSHPLPPSPFPMSSSFPLCVISLSGYHSFS